MKEKKAIIVVDLTFGDAGKGTVVDYLARVKDVHTVIRFNGGSQAGHNVMEESGRHHTFSQFGSGTFVPGVETYLSRFMLIDPIAIMSEGEELEKKGVENAYSRLSVDSRALIITPFQVSANRLRELSRGDGRHGSCGKGIGETMSDWLEYGDQVLFAGDLLDDGVMDKKLNFIRLAKMKQLEDIMDNIPDIEQARIEKGIIEECQEVERIMEYYRRFRRLIRIVREEEKISKIFKRKGTVIFEGAQGVLIDEWNGFHPYTTWSTTTFKNATQLLQEYSFDGTILRLGLFRAYATRHGPGPFVTEDEQLGKTIPDMHNKMHEWQRQFRVGWFDLVAARYALAVSGGADALAITNLDRFSELSNWRVCDSYLPPKATEKGVEKFFLMTADEKEKIVSGIKVKPALEDLEYQGELTELTERCQPRYLDLEFDERVTQKEKEDKYIHFLESELNIPVVLVSRGPMAKDKEERKRI